MGGEGSEATRPRKLHALVGEDGSFLSFRPKVVGFGSQMFCFKKPKPFV